MKVIDIHSHILPASLRVAYENNELWYGTKIERNKEGRTILTTGKRKNVMSTPEYWTPYKERIALMDDAEVDTQLLSLNPQLLRDSDPIDIAFNACKDVNDEIANAVSNRPDRYQGLGTIPIKDPERSISELNRIINELNLKGIIIGSHIDHTNLNQRHFFEILMEAEKLGAFILLHPLSTRAHDIMGEYHLINLIGNPMETTTAAANLIFSGFMDQLPNIKICLSHAGGYLPFAIGRFDHAYNTRKDVSDNLNRKPSDYLRNFYYDTITHSDTGLKQVIEIIGSDRILLGTDFPADMGVKKPLKWIESINFSEDIKNNICSVNAENALGLNQ
jgi:aminocarboxymuconate-semialdehyde decarboxylase|tara:strand:+ start:958 stop:1956 length:999 start_codon:yes stop_codon:yes gene_type:complete